MKGENNMNNKVWENPNLITMGKTMGEGQKDGSCRMCGQDRGKCCCKPSPS